MKRTALLTSILLIGSSACADILIETVTTSGNRQQDAVGIQFRIDSGLAAFDAGDYTLDSFTFRQGSAADSATLWLDIYQAPTSAPVGGLDFTPGSEVTTGLTYLGSSTTSLDWSGGNEDLTYTFSGITLTADRDIFVAISSDNVAGGFVQAGHHSVNGAWNDNADFTNLTLANYSELVDSDTGDGLIFSANVTAIPEPSSIALLGIAGLTIMAARLRKR